MTPENSGRRARELPRRDARIGEFGRALVMTMFSIETCPLPDGALLGRYAAPRAFTDCYVTEVGLPVTIARFVTAFYTTPVFRLERRILASALARPSTDAEAEQLANGLGDTFSAWRVEDRREDQLLVADMKGRTRSWFMVSPDQAGTAPRTRLYFGSAVLPVVNPETGASGMSLGFRALLGFHHLYSEVLLSSARSRLEAQGR